VALVKLGEDTLRDTIVNAVVHGEQELAMMAVSELERANYHGVATLVALKAEGQQLDQALSRVRDQLIEQLGEDDPEIRRASAAALGSIGDAQAIEPLLKLLPDASNLVRFHAASSLARLGHEQGIEFLFNALADVDPILRLNAIKSLVRVQRLAGGVEARLLACLTEERPALRSGAAQVLGQAGVHDALNPLLGLTDDEQAEVRWNAAIALGHLRADTSREALQKLTDDSNETVVYYAQWALQQLGAG
jgi:HEAT repeat protein